MRISPDSIDMNILIRISRLRKQSGISEEISIFTAEDEILLKEKDSKYLAEVETNSQIGSNRIEWISWGQDDPEP